MQIYKLYGDPVDKNIESKEKAVRNELAHRIAFKTEEFNRNDNETLCFVSDITNNEITVGIITKRRVKLLDLADEFAAYLDLDTVFTQVEEITINSLQSLLNCAYRQDYIDSEDEILEKFELDKITGRMGRGINFGENLVREGCRKDDLKMAAESYFMNKTLLPELERIYAGKKFPNAPGHPVHYMVETDDRDVRREVYKIILDALYANSRFPSRRYAFLDFRPGDSYSKMAFETLYKVCDGGAVVIRYLANDDSEDDGTVSGEHEVIENICDMARIYRNRVLTVICLPRECKKVKSVFYEYLGNMAFVEVREDLIGGDMALAVLSDLARDHSVRPDKKLTAKFDPEKAYLPTELRELFFEWYNDKLKNSVYPQYKDISVARREVAKAAPRGSAYDDLTEMIGLTEAKQVIRKALNYYKIQKLYEEKGVRRDHPAMHMVFTGNPGTAKTTVARLFARIMKENGLLSKGQLVEVGRGDLVGKYVGWTAKTVQAKFKEAIGGVIFIDEAYSLVDDRSGSFGDEAINTIVQEMENNRDKVVVIFAGYPDKMEGFLRTNPGLRSRIAFHVPFADYNTDELCRIARLISEKNGMHINDGAMSKLANVFDIARSGRDFGNGRYVRNVFEHAKMNQASRLLENDIESLNAEDVTTITADDITLPEKQETAEKRRIGFC